MRIVFETPSLRTSHKRFNAFNHTFILVHKHNHKHMYIDEMRIDAYIQVCMNILALVCVYARVCHAKTVNKMMRAYLLAYTSSEHALLRNDFQEAHNRNLAICRLAA